MNKCAVLKYRVHPGLKQGPLDPQSYALPLSYVVMSIAPNNTT